MNTSQVLIPWSDYMEIFINWLVLSTGEKEPSAVPGLRPPQQSVSQAQQQKQQELLRSAVLEATAPKEPPPDYEFIADPPSISAFDLDVVSVPINSVRTIKGHSLYYFSASSAPHALSFPTFILHFLKFSKLLQNRNARDSWMGSPYYSLQYLKQHVPIS